MEVEYVRSRWSPDGDHELSDERVGIRPANAELHRFVHDVAGRFLACVRGVPLRAVDFEYCLFLHRGQADGFLRLDVNGTVMVAGFDRERTLKSELLDIALRYATFRDEPHATVFFWPAIAFGATERFGYYITSSHELGIPDPSMVRAAVRFIAEFVIVGGHLAPRSREVLASLKRGTDDLGLLEVEPLIAAMIEAVPHECRTGTVKEIAREIGRVLADNHDAN